MYNANLFCFVPKSSEDKKTYKEQLKQKVTSNVVKLSFDDLKRKSQTYLNAQPTLCSSCQSALNIFSVVKSKDGQTNWNCEFCNYDNILNVPYKEVKLPTKSDVFYMLNKKNEKSNQEEKEESKVNENIEMIDENEQIDLTDKKTVIFCLDNSGSMSSGTVFQDEDGQSKYMSRKQCVERALQNQVSHMQKYYPNRKVGIVLFSKDVLILGDCQGETVNVSKDGSFEKLFEIGQNHYQKLFKLNVGSNNSIAQRFKETRTSGSTALGPGLAVSLGLASQSEIAGSIIILCTDGMANEGIGKLEDERDVKTYEKMAELAKSQGILIHTVTMRGMDSDVRVLGQLAIETGGRASRVGPADFNKNFIEIMKSNLVATKVEIVIQLHEGLSMLEGTAQMDLGNVTDDTSVTFSYMVKEDYDFQGVSSIPLQAKIFFRTPEGHFMLRTITKMQEITHEKEKETKNVQINILAGHATKMNAKNAQFGSIEQAEVQNKVWNNYICNEVFANNASQQGEMKSFVSKQKKLDNAISNKKNKNVSNNIKQADLDDCEQDFFDLY